MILVQGAVQTYHEWYARENRVAIRPGWEVTNSTSAGKELSVHCVLNSVDESTDVRRLGLNLGRSLLEGFI
jgi:hypothetical protein